MNAELRQRIIAYNRKAAEHKEKAADMEILAAALFKLPPGLLRQILTEEVLTVLQKYGAV